jgi:hypothetical protein
MFGECSDDQSCWATILAVLGCLYNFFLRALSYDNIAAPTVAAMQRQACIFNTLRCDSARRHGRLSLSGRKVIITLDHVAAFHISPHKLTQASHVVISGQRRTHQTTPFSCEGRSATGSINVNVLRWLFVESSNSGRVSCCCCACTFCPSQRSYMPEMEDVKNSTHILGVTNWVEPAVAF